MCLKQNLVLKLGIKTFNKEIDSELIIYIYIYIYISISISISIYIHIFMCVGLTYCSRKAMSSFLTHVMQAQIIAVMATATTKPPNVPISAMMITLLVKGGASVTAGKI